MRPAILGLFLLGASACNEPPSRPASDTIPVTPVDQRLAASELGTTGDRGSSDRGAASDHGAADRGPAADHSGGTGCGYQGTGTPTTIGANIKLCLPKVVCTAETCPPPLGTCSGGACVWKSGYSGLATLPEAWTTYYCELASGGCHGVTQIAFPEVNADAIAKGLGLPTCAAASAGAKCVGIAASSPLLVGNSQVAIDPATGTTVKLWGLGLTEASGLCYELQGPGGTVVVALTDRCGGYCKCKGSGYQECGPCVSASDMAPNCACVGTVPGLFSACCGMGCSTTLGNCDWCASNNHPHFDLDTAAFGRLCGAQAGNGSCKLSKVSYVSCLTPKTWPPGGSSGSCKTGSFWCSGPAPHQVQVPGTSCCCNWDLTPQADGTCK